MFNRKKVLASVERESSTEGIPMGQVYMPFKNESLHLLTVGKTGAGKTQMMSQALEYLINRSTRCIIHDPKMEYVGPFYNPKRDLIFNPLDTRSLKWNIIKDINTLMDVDAIASSLIPDGQKDSFWNDAARGVFKGILTAIKTSEDSSKRSTEQIWNMVVSDANSLIDIFSKTEGTEAGLRYINVKGEKGEVSRLTESILSVLMQYACCFQYMRGEHNFSVLDWLKNGRGNIFITNHADVRDTLKPLLSLFIDFLGRKVLSMPEDPQNRLFFFLDEFGSLQKMPTIIDLLTKGRSKGGCVFLGIQDYAQIDHIYGQHLRQSIVNSCGNSVVFSVADAKTAGDAADNIGEEEYIEKEKSIRGGEISLHDRTKRRHLYMPSEIRDLPNLTGILKLNSFPYSRIKWKYKNFERRQKAFELADGFTFFEDKKVHNIAS